ncbi:DUF3090 family protein [Actinocorallia sp. API 0066]|uniref:DUF3090 family protein n=1 Tax=Actinocorallia sp. API 0066 TaxID=2896846 RepID=UPI001E2ADD40|nr:DUF3090 family protein [Actinocorallia sp. API 0066]MCD0450143.1 DUF3090 family protein [Actinocorallia sp. API 0066]
MPVISYDMPDRFVAGTIGQPGQRAFYLQARDGARTTSVGLEKFQVGLLAERLEELLDEVLRRSGGVAHVPALTPEALRDDSPLDLPVEEEFRVGSLSLAWDPERELVIIEAAESAEADAGEPDPEGDTLRVSLSAARARAFAERALRLVAAGRPPCPLCGLPLDAAGHVCPRQNGHLRTI